MELLAKREIWILMFIQSKSFPKEMNALEIGNMVARRGMLLKLALIFTEEGLIRIAGRIGKTEIQY